MYPMRKPLLAPTFIGAWTGSDKHLPMQQHAYADPRAREATEVMVRLLRNHDAYEANQFEENNAFLVAGSIFPYFYALVGERNPKQAPQPKPRSEYSPLACDAFELIRRAGPISKQKMREDLGGSISFVALDHALGELWSKLRITRVDYKPEEGASWDVLYRWAPDAVREGIGLSVGEALVGAAVEISGLRDRRRPAGSGIVLRQFCPPLPGEGSDQCAAGRARTGFHSRRQPLPDPTGPTQSPRDRQGPRGGPAVRPCEQDR